MKPALFNKARFKAYIIAFTLLITIKSFPQNYIKIMPLGNSITFDTYSGDARPDGDKISYRYRLYQNLIGGGYNFDFVGSEKSGGNFLPTASPDYSDNAGFPGITTSQLYTLLQTGSFNGCQLPLCPQNYLEYYKPDVILLHIGTNGLSSNDDADAMISDLTNILNLIDNYENTIGNKVPVFLAQIINRAPDGTHAPTTYYNSGIASLVTSRPSDALVLVNMETAAGINYQYSSSGGDMIDVLHPDVSGYNKMGDNWYNAINTYNFNPILDNTSFSINENTSNGTTVGIVTGRDLDPGTTLSYSIISQSPANAFSINSSTGTITVSNSSLLDYETNPVFILTVRVNDGSLTDDAQVTINLVNVNEAPVITVPGAQSVAEDVSLVFNNTNGNLISIADPDNTSLTFTVNVSNGTFTLSTLSGLTGSGNGTSLLSYSGTLLSINSALNGASFKGTENYYGSASVTIAANDLSGGTDSETINITVTAVNDAPVITVPGAQSVAENVSLVFNNANGNLISIADPDNTSLTLTVNVSNGTFTLSTLSGLTGSGNGGTSLNYSGTLVSINNALNGASFKGTENYYGSASVTITANDGSGGTDSEIINITVTAVNDAPVITVPGAQSVAEDVSLVFNNTNGNLISIADPDNTSLSFTVSVSNGTFTLSTLSGLTGSGNGGNSLSYSGTLVSINSALNGASFKGTENYYGSASMTITANDGSGGTDSENINITVTAVNDAPVLNGIESSPLSYNENAVPTPVTSSITISDVDNINLSSASVAITSNYQNGQDVLSFTNANGITATWNATTGVLSLSGSSSLANYQTALRNVLYQNTSNNPSTLTRTVSFTVSDGTASSNTVTRNISIIAANDPPVASSVNITPADNRIGILNTGNYTYTDPEEDPEGTSTYKWYRSATSDGAGAVAISGATGKTYTPSLNDGGNYICFEVTPIDNKGGIGTPVKSTFKYINAAPVASGAYIYVPPAGAEVGQTIRGRFTYSDKESNASGNAIYQWYRSTSSSPTPSSPGTAIGTDSTYKIKSADGGKYIWFKVKPVATAGSTPGDSIWSNVIGPVGSFSASISGTAIYCPGITMPITLTITGGNQPYIATLRRTNSPLNKDTTITGISSSPYTLQVKIPGTYTLLSVTDTDEESAILTGTEVTLSNYTKPTVKLTGSTQICSGASAQLIIDFVTGSSPWSFSLKKNLDPPVIYSNVTKDTSITVTLSGQYKITNLNDRYCTGDTVAGYGTATISYITSPFATISGTDTICPADTARLNIIFTGTSPWSVTYLRNGVNPQTINNITQPNYTLKVVGDGTYTLSAVSDAIRSGCVSGSGKVVHRTVPTANITGTASICEHTTYDIRVTLTGTQPWNFRYHRGTEPATQITNVITSPYYINVNKAGTYTLIDVYDKYCKGTVSGSAVITVTPAPNVTITGLYPAYSKQVNWDTATVSPTKGELLYDINKTVIVYNNNDKFAFSPMFSNTGIHSIVYKYRDPSTFCYGYDTAVVAVLEANADIVFPENDTKKFFCYNEPPFLISAYNTANDTGSFTISGGTGLADHHNNTATIYPSQLSTGKYTITYTYYEHGAPLSINEQFEVEFVNNIWFIGFEGTSYCDNASAIKLNGNMQEGIFSGKAVYGNLSSGFYFDPKLTIPGNDTVFYTYTTAKGCSRQVYKAVTILDAADINFTVNDTCVSQMASDSTAFINLTTYTDPVVSWLWNFDDIGSGAGNTSTLKNPKHKYASAERRFVTLTATTSSGCTSTKQIRLNFGDSPNADFEWASECFHPGQKVKFTNKSFINPDKGTIIYNKWKFYSGQTYDSILAQHADYLYSATGIYNVELIVRTNYGCTDTILKTLPLKPTIKISTDQSYYETFEDGPKGWVSNYDVTGVNSWKFGEPNEGFIGAASGKNAWYTNITTDPSPREQSWVTSPCFDFSSALKPMIKFNFWRLFNPNFARDGAVLQYTADSGKTWINTGQYLEGINWFNDFNISGKPGNQYIGWSKTVDNSWTEARHDLDDVRGKKDIQFRLAYGSDGTARGNEGLAFDNVWIGERNKIVLMEHFTNSSDQLSRQADSLLNMLANNNPLDIVDIQYHTSYPGYDPFNELNSIDPTSRTFYYGVTTSIPSTIMNGGTTSAFRFDYNTKPLEPVLIKTQALNDPKFRIRLDVNKQEDAIVINADLTALQQITNRQVTLHIAVIERVVRGITGTNGQTVFESVLKQMLPDAGGTVYTQNWNPGDNQTVSFTWPYNNVYNPDEIRVVAFVQDEQTQEIYQTAIDRTDPLVSVKDNKQVSEPNNQFIIFPNPLSSSIIYLRFNQTLEKKADIYLFDNTGKIVSTEEIYPGNKLYQINMENYPDGFYFIRISSDNQFMGTHKLIIAR